MLKIDRSEPSDLNISEDPVVYSPKEIKNLLQRIDEGNRATGGLTPVAKVFGIAGKSITILGPYGCSNTWGLYQNSNIYIYASGGFRLH